MTPLSSNTNPPSIDKNFPPSLDPHQLEKRLINRRQIWAANRFWMEIDSMKTRRYGKKSHHHWTTLLFMMNAFKYFTKFIGLYKRGVRNAKNIQLLETPLSFINLPEEFDGFTILLLSDLHLDSLEGLEHLILNTLDNRAFDLCLLTGDYRTRLHGPNRNIISKLKYLIEGINSREGFLGVLGNHDDCHMVNPLEKIGMRLLINESCLIQRGSSQIQIIGTDDVHYYYTDQALHALEQADNGFSVAMVHSPELFDFASEMDVDLYLCGHTHAGQVCLPGGIPIIKHLNKGRRYYRGEWDYQGMKGITSAGVGTSGIPVRFNTRGEILILKLLKKSL